MIGSVFDRKDLNGRFLVFWNDEDEIHHAGYETKQEAERKLQEVFVAAAPKEVLENPEIKNGLSKMEIEEEDIILFDDVAYCAMSNPPFNAILVDVENAA